MNSVELRHLRTLVAVVDEGGFTQAASFLGVSQAAVSRTIAGLEQALGARVLHRTTREVALSPAGSRMIGHARRVVAETAALVRAVSEASAELRVGYAWAALGRHTTPVQRQWAVDHGGAELVFVQSNTPTAGLAEGLVDVAVLRRPLEDGRFATAIVGVEPRFAAVRPGTPWLGGATSRSTTSPAAPSLSTAGPGRPPSSSGRPTPRPRPPAASTASTSG